MISYEDIRDLQMREKNDPSLQEIDPEIFKEIKEYIEEKERAIKESQKDDNPFAEDIIEKNKREIQNIKKLMEDLCYRRYKKIITLALNSVKSKVIDTTNMLDFEEEFYRNLVKDLKKQFETFLSKIESKEENKPESGEKLTLVRFKEDVPSFVWKDNKVYGPFKKEDLANLPEEVAKIITGSGKGEEVENEKI